MRYWDDMNDKYGFGDGGSTPPDAEACRKAYVLIVNGLAAIRGSKVRLVGYERGGCHNSIMVMMIPAEALSRIPLHDGYPLTDSIAVALRGTGLEDEPKTDDIMDDIICELQESGEADDVVKVEIRVDHLAIRHIFEDAKEEEAKKAKKT